MTPAEKIRMEKIKELLASVSKGENGEKKKKIRKEDLSEKEWNRLQAERHLRLALHYLARVNGITEEDKLKEHIRELLRAAG